ncbi:hypothetical protein L1887_01064 [Cichorium endivia]|nr:hypothetical protein L1887_01064 [Cichorium endivia]
MPPTAPPHFTLSSFFSLLLSKSKSDPPPGFMLDCGGGGGIKSGNDVGLQWFKGLRVRLVRGFICLNSSRFGGFSGGSA